MDQAIEDGMLEFLSDNFATLTAEDKATGGLLAQDEKKGVERLIEGMQLIPWSSMERQSRPNPGKIPKAANSVVSSTGG